MFNWSSSSTFGIETPIAVFDTHVNYLNLIGCPVCALVSDGKLERRTKSVFLGFELG